MFDGDFTVESDKERLVDTVLGLWAHSLVKRHETTTSNPAREDSASTEQHKMIFELVEKLGKEAVFPASYFGNMVELLEEKIVRGRVASFDAAARPQRDRASQCRPDRGSAASRMTRREGVANKSSLAPVVFLENLKVRSGEFSEKMAARPGHRDGDGHFPGFARFFQSKRRMKPGSSMQADPTSKRTEMTATTRNVGEPSNVGHSDSTHSAGLV